MVSNTTARINRETKTISAMLSLYCKNHHPKNGRGICDNCIEVQEYALKRLQSCPFIENKPTCANCLVHCYNKEMQNKVRQIMRYSGPRLLLFHPILAIRHLLDGRIKPPSLKKKTETTPSNVNDKTGGKTL
jgi:Nitrous oxide-stimulated promoter